MTIAIRSSEKRLKDLNEMLKRTLNRLKEEELIIERSPNLFLADTIIIPRVIHDTLS